ncbi:hypothetical protein [Fluviicola sp.]|uniref:hypothetical protein n=1 Tax=Fluviicola sp. TaxID=1917219 RepID=UPI002638BA4D|nr:hypothetical protein [Fluviicola sp.]
MRYLIQQNIVLFVISLIIYYYNPSLGLVLLSISIGLFVWEITRKKTKLSPILAVLSCVSLFLLLEDYSTKRQAKIIVAEVFNYYRNHHQTPKNLDEVFFSGTMMKTAIFEGFTYGGKILSEHRCEWKLEFSNMWGTHYFYNDRVGKFEEMEHLSGTNESWNTFWRVESHLKATDHRGILE